MKRRLFFGLGAFVLMGALLWGAYQLAAPTPVSQADAETFARANQLYANGQYAAAAGLYQQLTAQGVKNADLYHNLGNAYKAVGDAKGASEAYADAYALAPREVDIANAAGRNSGIVPVVTESEIALAALALTMLLALVVVGVRHRDLHSTVPAV